MAEDNRINGLSSSGNTVGLYFDTSTGVLAAGNRIAGAVYGIKYLLSSGKYMDNLTSNVTTPFSGGTDAGGNG